MVIAHRHLHILPDGAGGNLAYADTPHKGGIVHAGNQHPQGGGLVALRRRNVLQDGVEQRL